MTTEHNLKKQIAKKYGVTLRQVEEIIASQEEFIATVIGKYSDREKLYFPAIRLPGFGTFYCPEYLKKIFKEKRDESISDRD